MTCLMSSDRESDTSSILYLCKDIQHYLRSFVPCRDTIGLALTNKMPCDIVFNQ